MKHVPSKFSIRPLAAALLIGLAARSAAAAALSPAERAYPMPADPSLPTLWIIGDSTVHVGTAGELGWGEPIAGLFDTSRINVVNRAIGGRSSRTFRTEGRWQKVLDLAKPGDFVLMQFGHNDAGKLAGDNRERGSIRGNGDETQEVTLTLNDNAGKKEVVHSFGWYMRQYVTEAKAKGLNPIVCSYIPRCPRPATSKPTATDAPVTVEEKPASPAAAATEMTSYQLWAKQAADAAGGAFIDLDRIVSDKYAKMAPEDVKKRYFTEADYTHTSPAGAELNAHCVVEGLQQIHSPLVKYLKAGAAEGSDPAKHD